MIVWWLVGCLADPWSLPPDVVPVRPPGPAIALARTAGATLVLPDHSRAVPDEIRAFVAFERVHEGTEGDVWATPLPVAAHLFRMRQAGAAPLGWFEPSGVTVSWRDQALSFARGGQAVHGWGYDAEQLYVGLPKGETPGAGEVVVDFPKAMATERGLHLDASGLEPTAFALRTLTIGTTSHTGVLLPAPGEATWQVTVPQGAVLAARVRVLPPAIRDGAVSDGAHLTVVIGDEGVATIRAGEAWQDLRVPLPAGPARIGFRTADPDPTLDLVFVEDPTIYVPSKHPKRVVVAFVDTVRADHLGMYGYDKPTTPRLDAWAKTAVRFDQARSVAPWTLPSARTAVTGVQPEDFYDAPTLAERLGAEGFHTAGIVTNAYLSQVFDMHRGFATYDYELLLPAPQVVDRAIDVLGRFPDRDLLLYTHFMEAHLPYHEPVDYRWLFTRSAPAGLELTREALVETEPDDAAKAHIVGRYDANLRVLDDALSELFEAAGPDATTVLFADHGEEFWEHGGFEHGHTFHDDVLRVPLVVRSPALRPGVVTEPVSLLDVTPTLLALAGVQAGGLLSAANGDTDARLALAARPQAFGRAVYGDEGWAVLSGGRKWVHRGGTQVVWDPSEGERDDLAASTELSVFPPALSEALGRGVDPVWRLTWRPVAGVETSLVVRHPAGIAEVWKGYDPKGFYETATPRLVDGRVELATSVGGPVVLYLRPMADGPGLEVDLADADGDESWTAGALTRDGTRRVVLSERGSWGVSVDVVFAPEPSGVEVVGFDVEVQDALEALGYVE